MDDTIEVALLVSVIAPVLGGLALGWTQRRGNAQTAVLAADARKAESAQKKLDREDDWARQDKVAERAEKAAAAIVEANKHTSDVVEKGNLEVLEVTRSTHDLVNSAMTTQKELTLTFAKTTLTALQQNAMVNPESISVEQQAEIDSVAAKVKELEVELEERKRQQKAIDEEKHAKALAAVNAEPTIVSFAEPQPVIVQGPAPRASSPDK